MDVFEKCYLGDGINARFDGVSVVLTHDDGKYIINIIRLDVARVRAFLEYHEQLKSAIAKWQTTKKETE